MEQFEEEGYLCLFFSFKRSQVPDSKILFWTTFSDYLVRTAPEHIEDQIKSSNDFVNLFSKRPFQNPNFTQEQVQFLFKEYANEERIIINQEVIKDIYMRTNGHAGWPCHQLRKSYR
ncbi:uncharacterized protein OCT59_012485 [Rhizophagus irregularis]|uniref:uncharacterized protein n=1 Tax=Rhizophagus irregularis TaxID=588596 RepID=UPI00332F5748|nr:hypothetical protein OCT59_012485 [Rhizophagus irregularis]